MPCNPLLQAGPIEDVWTIAGKVRKLVLVPLRLVQFACHEAGMKH